MEEIILKKRQQETWKDEKSCVCEGSWTKWTLLCPLKDTRETVRLPISHLSDSRQTPAFACPPFYLQHHPLNTTSGRENKLESAASYLPSGVNELTNVLIWFVVSACPPAVWWFTLSRVSPSRSRTRPCALSVFNVPLPFCPSSTLFSWGCHFKNNIPHGIKLIISSAVDSLNLQEVGKTITQPLTFGIDSVSQIIQGSIVICLWPALGK